MLAKKEKENLGGAARGVACPPAAAFTHLVYLITSVPPPWLFAFLCYPRKWQVFNRDNPRVSLPLIIKHTDSSLYATF